MTKAQNVLAVIGVAVLVAAAAFAVFISCSNQPDITTDRITPIPSTSATLTITERPPVTLTETEIATSVFTPPPVTRTVTETPPPVTVTVTETVVPVMP